MGQPRQTRYCYDWILLPAVLSSSREIYREITDSPETLSAHNMPRGLDLYIYCRTFEIGARRMEARTNSPWMSQKRTRQFPRGTSQPYPGVSSVALIYVLVSDVTRVRPLYSRRGDGTPRVCTKDPPSYYPGRSVYKWPKLGLIVFVIGTGNLARWFIIFAFARLVLSQPIVPHCKVFAWPIAKFLLSEELISIVQTVVNIIYNEMKDSLNNFIIISKPSGYAWCVHL